MPRSTADIHNSQTLYFLHVESYSSLNRVRQTPPRITYSPLNSKHSHSISQNSTHSPHFFSLADTSAIVPLFASSLQGVTSMRPP